MPLRRLVIALTVAALGAAPAPAAPRKADEKADRKAVPAEEAPSPALKERIARLALRQVAFGSVSLLPVRFESSRLAGPIEDAGRTIYCVSSQMKGRA